MYRLFNGARTNTLVSVFHICKYTYEMRLSAPIYPLCVADQHIARIAVVFHSISYN